MQSQNEGLAAAFPGQWLICFAVKEEAKPFTRQPRENVRSLITRMGRANAERTFGQALTQTRPSLVLTCGFAGGLDPALPKGAVLFETDSPSLLASQLAAAGARPGKFHCADRVAVTAYEKWSLRESTRADAVEMESAHIRSICHELGIPSATVRVILDTADQDLPVDFNRVMSPEQDLDLSKLALQLMKSPRIVKGLLALQKDSRQAAEALATVLDRLVS